MTGEDLMTTISEERAMDATEPAPEVAYRAVLVRSDGEELAYLVRPSRRAARTDVSVLLALEPEFSFGRVEPVALAAREPEVSVTRRASAGPDGAGGWTLNVQRGASVVDIEAALADLPAAAHALGVDAGDHGGDIAIALVDGGQ
jgi:hypothetical protein